MNVLGVNLLSGMQRLSSQRLTSLLFSLLFNSVVLCKDFQKVYHFFNDSSFVSLVIGLYLASYFKVMKHEKTLGIFF